MEGKQWRQFVTSAAIAVYGYLSGGTAGKRERKASSTSSESCSNF